MWIRWIVDVNECGIKDVEKNKNEKGYVKEFYCIVLVIVGVWVNPRDGGATQVLDDIMGMPHQVKDESHCRGGCDSPQFKHWWW